MSRKMNFANSVNADQALQTEASDQSLHCLPFNYTEISKFVKHQF